MGPALSCRTRFEVSLKTIYIGNLSFNTSEEQLRAAFEAYGQVDRVNLITDRDTGQSRGFAFVDMVDAGAADRAIAELNGTDMGGRTVTVNEARPKAERGGAGGSRDRGPRRGGGGGGGRGRW